MAKVYRHSELMAALKSTEEQIQDNYSSAQYVEVWDTLLYSALEPILLCTTLADRVIADVLHFYVENHRRKLSSLQKDLVMSSLARFLVAAPENKAQRLKQCRLERNILRLITTTFLEETKHYQGLTVEKTKTKKENPRFGEIEHSLYLIESHLQYNQALDLFSAVNTVRFWQDQADSFKNMIMEKYMRLIVVQAQQYYKTNNSNLELDDILQNLVIYTSKALDKYDPRKGTLSSYIQLWFQHGKNVTAVNEAGIAFVLPVAKRSNVGNLSVPIDNAEVLDVEYECGDNVELDSLRKRVQLLAKLADPVGFGRVSLGISEVLTSEEIALQKKYSHTPKSVN